MNPSGLTQLTPQTEAVRADLELILQKAGLEGAIDFQLTPSPANSVKIRREDDKVWLDVSGDCAWGQAFYMGLQRLGFQFPHPRMQVSPTLSEIKRHDGETYEWKPAVRYSGFHFHTLHPSEWVQGFLMGKTEIAIETVRWLARNQQNVFDLSLLNMDEAELFANLREPFRLARRLGIHTGVALGMAFRQQRSFKLISFLASFFEARSLKELESGLERLLGQVEVSFLNLEAGTTEFTPTAYDLCLKWMNRAAEVAARRNVSVFIKTHTSSNQRSEKYGNFNFLPKFADPKVGVLPHTVFLYDLEADSAPMYGNRDFSAIKEFMLEQKSERPTWFYPETSYFCGLDIDVPLFLTDYLLSRAKDTKFLFDRGIDGQLCFSTGQELGYWLFDWTYALLNNRDYGFDPLAGLRLLGEDLVSWRKVIDFQNEYFVKKGLVSVLTFQTMGDELLTGFYKTLERNLIRDLKENPRTNEKEIALLKSALENLPTDLKIANRELQLMWRITEARISHALNTRLALFLSDRKNDYLKLAEGFRIIAQECIDEIKANHSRYPETSTFERHENPTAYQWGYGWLAKDLYYWRREEEMVRHDKYHFLFMPLFSVKEIVEGWVY